jgi:segregation and condensation protein B
MEKESLDAKLEAILFIYGEPLSLQTAAKILQVSLEEIRAARAVLEKRLLGSGSGLTLLTHGENMQLVTKPAFAQFTEAILKSELQEELTPAALETLSIIAYAGLVSRSIIDYIRGVNSSFILRSLLIRGLIERSLDPGHGNAYRYAPSFELLRHFGLSRFEELPDFSRLNGLLQKLTPGSS